MEIINISMADFNPEILYITKSKKKDHINARYHCHEFIEFSYVVSGHVTYMINDKQYEVNEKTLLPFNPGIYHKESLNPGDNTTELHIGFKNIQIKGLDINKLQPDESVKPFEFEHYKEEFHKCCLEIMEEENSCDICSEPLLKSLVMKLISLFIKEMNYKINTEKASPNFPFYDKSNIVKIILDYFDSNYMYNISLDNISKTLYISSVYVSKVFKERTGESPINYLINLRLGKAKKLLLESNLSVKEISQLVGYKDAYYFSKLFKKYYGKSPSAFRENASIYSK